ncbi:hypothetical protein QR680_011953 [Steinernema hermaphroditum]|uniref:Uncharacterized protein n=1 Tax=Steinernema hermaphroditum TaxID=289476 RepID=A0AA39I0C4_9BILA|nr:hypothetical protein QR680_011953 [Steinernema hermaphroditum]
MFRMGLALVVYECAMRLFALYRCLFDHSGDRVENTRKRKHSYTDICSGQSGPTKKPSPGITTTALKSILKPQRRKSVKFASYVQVIDREEVVAMWNRRNRPRFSTSRRADDFPVTDSERLDALLSIVRGNEQSCLDGFMTSDFGKLEEILWQCTDHSLLKPRCVELIKAMIYVLDFHPKGLKYRKYFNRLAARPGFPLIMVMEEILDDRDIRHRFRYSGARVLINVNRTNRAFYEGHVSEIVFKSVARCDLAASNKNRHFVAICLDLLQVKMMFMEDDRRQRVMALGYVDYLYTQLPYVKDKKLKFVFYHCFAVVQDFEALLLGDHRVASFYNLVVEVGRYIRCGILHTRSSKLDSFLEILLFQRYPNRFQEFCEAGLFYGLLKSFNKREEIFAHTCNIMLKCAWQNNYVIKYFVSINFIEVLEEALDKNPNCAKQQSVRYLIQWLSNASTSRNNYFHNNFAHHLRMVPWRAPDCDEVGMKVVNNCVNVVINV